MDKKIQAQINAKCIEQWNKANHEYHISFDMSCKKLRNCSAYVLESKNYYFLKSYATVVAFIDKKDSVLYDVLRYVYRYTATSAQHISKFSYDYYNHARFTYYPC